MVVDVEEPSASPKLDETENRVNPIPELVARGDVARDSGRYRDAAAFYGEALGIDPDDTVLRVQCAQMFIQAGETANAEHHYLEAIRLAPDDSQAALRLGRFYKEAGQIKQASAAFERASRLSPNWTEPADELAELFRQGWRGGAAEGEPATNEDSHAGQASSDQSVRGFDEVVSELQRTAAGNRLIPEIVPRTPAEMMVSYHEAIELLSFGRLERSHWGMTSTFRGVEAIRGYCLSLSPPTELQILLNGALIHRGPLRGGYPIQNERNRDSLLKYVFNSWVDLSQFAHGLHELTMRFVLSGGETRVRHERIVIAEPFSEQDHPDSDGVISLSADDARSIDDQINSRPSTVHGFARATLPQPIQNVLILRTDQLGDLVTSIPALRRVRELLPNSNIVGLLTSANAALAATLGLFDEVIVANFSEDPLQGRRTMTLEDQESLRSKLAPYRFDLAMDLSVSGMSRILLLLSGARILYGVDSGEWPWLTVAFHSTTHDIKNRREAVPHSTRIVAFVERLATMLASKAEVIRRTDISRDHLKPTLGPLNDKSFVVLHSGARIKSSRWAGYVELATLLIERTALTVVLMSDEPLTRAALPEWLARSDRLLVIDQRLPFDDFDALLHFCSAFVGNDSGPKHLAALRGAKVVSIHSARVNWSEWGQEIGGSIISRKVPCAGCTIYFDENECGRDFDCISKVRVEEVMDALMKQIESDYGSAPLRKGVVSDPVASAEA